MIQRQQEQLTQAFQKDMQQLQEQARLNNSQIAKIVKLYAGAAEKGTKEQMDLVLMRM